MRHKDGILWSIFEEVWAAIWYLIGLDCRNDLCWFLGGRCCKVGDGLHASELGNAY